MLGYCYVKSHKRGYFITFDSGFQQYSDINDDALTVFLHQKLLDLAFYAYTIGFNYVS